MSDDNFKIILKSSDDIDFLIDKKKAESSLVLKSILDESYDDEMDSIPLPGIKSKELRRVIEFLEINNQSNMPEIRKPLLCEFEECTGKDFVNFINKYEISDIIEITNAANYLNIKNLLDLCCTKLASIIKGKTPNEIKNIFELE
tara:strand:- start:534 stop:968 length:435 start_codon:yes stop_codon:yes gene_type:complete